MASHWRPCTRRPCWRLWSLDDRTCNEVQSSNQADRGHLGGPEHPHQLLGFVSELEQGEVWPHQLEHLVVFPDLVTSSLLPDRQETSGAANNNSVNEVPKPHRLRRGQIVPALVCELVDERLGRVITPDKTPFEEFLHDSSRVLTRFLQGISNLASILRALGKQPYGRHLRFIELKLGCDNL